MKRIISFILAVAMLAGSFALTAFASEETVYTDAENFALSLGVIDRETYDADALVTRAEFAELVARFCGLKDPDAEYKQWNDAAFGEDSKDVPAQGSVSYAFSDIDVSLPQYEAISAVCANGYMNGVTSTHFLPNYNITTGAAVKVIVCMLGYEPIAQLKGGWPNGYLSVGDSLGVRKGINTGINDFVTYGQCLQMLYNVLDIGVYDFSSLDEEGITYERGESFLNSVLEMYRVTGKVTDNGITTFSGKSKVGTDAIVVDGVTLVTNKAEFHSANYLGREVEAYYKENKSGKNELVHLTVLNDDSITFASENFIGYKSGKISFEDENGKVVTKNLSANSYLIHNNKAKSDYTNDVFDFPFGEITLLKSDNGSEYDTIVINEYSAGKVRKVDSEEGVVYLESLYKGIAGIKKIELDEDSSGIVALLNSAGDAIAMEDIRVGDVISALVSEDGEYTEAYVSNKMAEGFAVSEYESDNDSFTVSDGENAYTFKNTGDMSSVPVINIGDGYDIYFDFAGNPVWIEKAGIKSGAKMAFLIDVAGNTNGFNDEYAIRFYSQDGIIETLDIGEKVILNSKTVYTKDVISDLEAKSEEIILYTTDVDNTVVKSITLPLDIGEEDTDDRGWYHISPKVRLSKNETETQEQWNTYVEANGMIYSPRGTSFAKSVHYAAGSTKVFTIPGNKDYYDREKYFSVTAANFKTGSKQTFNAYSTRANAMVAEAISFSTADVTGQQVSAMEVFLISKISKGLNDEEEEVTYLDGYIIDGNNWAVRQDKFVFTEDTVFVRGDNKSTVVDPDADGYDINVDGPARLSDLEVGDIIRYSVNVDNEILSMLVAYDCSNGNAFVDQSEKSTSVFYRGGISAGYPLYVDGNYVKLSGDAPHTVDLTDTETLKNHEKIMACDVKAATVFVVENAVRGKTVRKGSISDIETFEDTGELDISEYDRVAVPLYWGKTIGTVIYK